MARANIMMWLASTGNVILAKGFLRVLWLAERITQGSALKPARRRCLLDLRQRARPFAGGPLAGSPRGADRGVSRSVLAPLREPAKSERFQGPLPLAGLQGAAPLGGVPGRSPA